MSSSFPGRSTQAPRTHAALGVRQGREWLESESQRDEPNPDRWKPHTATEAADLRFHPLRAHLPTPLRSEARKQRDPKRPIVGRLEGVSWQIELRRRGRERQSGRRLQGRAPQRHERSMRQRQLRVSRSHRRRDMPRPTRASRCTLLAMRDSWSIQVLPRKLLCVLRLACLQQQSCSQESRVHRLVGIALGDVPVLKHLKQALRFSEPSSP